MKAKTKKLENFFKDKKHLKSMYNLFVETLNKNDIILAEFRLKHGISKINQKEVLEFDIETDSGFTEEEAKDLFAHFIEKHPDCSIRYNLREYSVFENELFRRANTVMNLSKGFKLEKI